jgi:hypothetical protein
VTQATGDRIEKPFSLHLFDRQRCGHGVRQERNIREPCEIDPPDAAGKIWREIRCNLKSHTCLPAPAGAGQGHEPISGDDQPRNTCQLRLPSNEGRSLKRQVVRDRVN